MDREAIQANYPQSRFTPVLISEVTRMSKGKYCVAGWDLHGDRMVRPLQPSGANWELRPSGSVFAVGHVVNCASAAHRHQAYPHATEDRRLSQVPSLLDALDEPQTYSILAPVCARSLTGVFGSPLVEEKYIEDGTVCPSLGGVRVPRGCVKFFKDGYGKLRLELRDREGTTYRLPVTCDRLLHFFSPGDLEAEPHFGAAEANDWLHVNPPNTEIILRIGLARGWVGPDQTWSPPRCYAQLNGIICPTDNYHIFEGS